MKITTAIRGTRPGRIFAAVMTALIVFFAGFLLRGCFTGAEVSGAAGPESEASGKSSEKTVWTCSMHPRIKLPKPGKCPICFMDLIPLKSDRGDDYGARELEVSEAARALIDIETAPVERRFVTAEVRMAGKIDFDETRVSYITAWIPGRLDRLFVDYTGVPVKKGDHMVSLYSPELLSAQEELLQAINSVRELEESDVPVIRETAQATVEAVREKLRLWGLTPAQIDAIEQRGKADDHMTIYAPVGGIVIGKNAQEGMYVNTGTRIYTIADLSYVWVKLDAYESDLRWLKYGQHIVFLTESYPGETFSGRIAFIQPVLDEATRTVKVRVNVSNEDGRLKPGMFVRAVAEARIATGGRVMDAALAGMWISPMHPEVVKDAPGACDVCGMPLVRAESLGYVGSEPTGDDKPLVIPASAALLTGKRAVVYVEKQGRDRPVFEGREVVLGPRAGDYYLVTSGLEQGERVVTHGAFKIDAELQIRAKPSMMTPASAADAAQVEAGAAGVNGEPADSSASPDPEFVKQIGVVVDGYLGLQTALAADDGKAAADAAGDALDALGKVDMGLVSGDAHMDWMKFNGSLDKLLSTIAEAKDIESARAGFALLSEEIAALLKRFGVPDGELYQAWCPMAFSNRGAAWIQRGEEIGNPYFGAMMLRCGEIKEVLK